MPTDERRIVFLGLDLSGPAKPENTVLTWLRRDAEGLRYIGHLCAASDGDIVGELAALTVEDEVILGIDAPLSYKDGGGFRQCDKDLQAALRQKELVHFVHVMSPVFGGMAWLTLRGIVLSRTVELLPEAHRIRIVEVHPGAVLGLRGAPVEALQRYKKGDRGALQQLKRWLNERGLRGFPESFGRTSHEVDSAAGALAAWQWFAGGPAWLAEAQPPERPYPFAC